MDRRTIIGILVCIAFFMAYNYFLQKKYPEYNKPVAEKPAGQPTAPEHDPRPSSAITATAPVSPAVESVPLLSADELRLETNDVVYQFDQEQGGLTSITLTNFREEVGSERPVQLVNGLLKLQPFIANGSKEAAAAFAAERQGPNLKLSRRTQDWLISETFQFDQEGYGGNIIVTFQNLSAQPRELEAGLFAGESIKIHEKSSSFLPDIANQNQAFIVGVAGGHDAENMKSYCEDDSSEPVLQGQGDDIDFLGFDHHYFATLFRPKAKKFNYKIVKSDRPDPTGKCAVVATLSQAQGLVGAGETISLEFRSFFGPKDEKALRGADEKFDEALNLGVFGVIGRPLLLVIKAIYRFVGNYGIAIIILTSILKILFYPLTRAAAVSMRNMQKFQPEMNRIREKFKDDRAAQQKEIMAFMAKHKINPAKGCLPVLPQIPVFIAFYNVLSQSIDLRLAPFYGWIKDLSVADPYFVSPILLGAGMFIQQRLTPNPSMDKTQQRIMLAMPLVFTVMMLSLPAGMVIYMITNTAISIAQQQWLNKKLGVRTQSVASTT